MASGMRILVNLLNPVLNDNSNKNHKQRKSIGFYSCRTYMHHISRRDYRVEIHAYYVISDCWRYFLQHLSEEKAIDPLATLEYCTPLDRLLDTSLQNRHGMYN